MQSGQHDIETVLDAGAVLQYLKTNPDFFNQHEDLLTSLKIPHPTGEAVSLIEKQVSVLRSRSSSLENSLRDFIAVARENEQLQNRLHRLVQDIISTSQLAGMVELVEQYLLSNFNADQVRMVVFEPSADDENSDQPSPSHFISRTDKRLAVFENHFRGRETVCGDPVTAELDVLFKKQLDSVASTAVIPLQHGRRLGLVMMISNDPERFASGKGVIFLNQLGEVLSRRVHAMHG